MAEVKEPKTKVAKPGPEKKHPNHMGMFGPAGLYGMDLLHGGGMFGPSGLYGLDLVKDKKKTDGAQSTAAKFNPYIQDSSPPAGKVEMSAAQTATEQKKTTGQTSSPVTEPVKNDLVTSPAHKPEITISTSTPATDTKTAPVAETTVKPAEKAVTPAVENKAAVSPTAGTTVNTPPVTTALATTTIAPVTLATAGLTPALGTGNAEVKTPEVKTDATGTAETDLTAATGDGSEGVGTGADNKDGGKDAVVKAPAKPESDPAFQAVLQQVKEQKDAQKLHPKALAKVSEAKKASHIDPTVEKKGLASKSQVRDMSKTEAKPFNANTFVNTLHERIKSSIPESMDAAKNFKKQNDLGQVKGDVKKNVEQGKATAGGDIKGANDAKLDTDKQTVTPAVPMKDDTTGAKPQVENANQAAPKPKTDAEISMNKEAVATDNTMAKNQVTDQQLAQSNEPTFTTALDGKNKAKEKALNTPAQYRLVEGPMLQKSGDEAQGDVGKGMAGIFGARGNAFASVNAHKNKAKSGDEEVRARVAAQLNTIYEGTKGRVTAILKKLDDDVDSQFDSAINQATETFKNNADRRVSDYDSFWHKVGRWIGGLPDEVDKIFVEEKQTFLNTVDAALLKIAVTVQNGLKAATDEIARGKKELDDYWNSQTPETKKIADGAYNDINGKYQELETQVENKQGELIDKLAKKYVDAVGQLQGAFDKIKEDNKSWLEKAADAVAGVIKAINDLKNMLLNTLSRVAHVIGDIVAHPIDFLGNMVSAVGKGFKNFASNILTHLKKGFFEWLLGVMPPGLVMPEKWDLAGIFHFVMQFFELTWVAIKAKVAKVVGQPVVDVLETAFDIFQVIKKDGIIGLWNYVKEKVGDLKTMVIDALMGMLQNQVVQAGITWLLGLLTPAGAFIKACQAIYGIVMWFVNNAKRIMELINSIIDSTALIVAGKLDSAANMVENAMARIIPIAIGFLAGLLNLGNIGKLVQDIINKVRAPIEKAIDWVVQKAVAVANQLGIPQMIKKGVAFVKGKVDAVKGKVNKMMGKGDEKDKKIHVEEHFTAKDGSDHELLFGEGSENKTLMVASWHPVALVKKLEEKLTGRKADDPMKPRLEHMLSEVKGIQERAAQLLTATDQMNQNSKDDVAKNKAMETNQAAIKAALDPLIPELVALEIMDNKELPPTVVTYEMKNGVAHKVVAAPLTKHSGNTQGSSPTQDKTIPLGWEYIIDDLQETDLWVKAHMLSERLHGPGDKDWNLVLGRKWLNSQMYHDAEKDAIDKIEGDKGKGEILRYETTVTNYTSDPNEPKIGSFFPLEMQVTYGSADKDGKFTGNQITKSFTQPAPRYKNTKDDKDLSKMSKTKLAAAIKSSNPKLTGDEANSIATVISELRKTHSFASFEDFTNEVAPKVGDKFYEIASNLEKAKYYITETAQTK